MYDTNEMATAATEGKETTAEGISILENETTPAESKKLATGTQKANVGVYVHKFRNLFEYEGKKYRTLNFYFERLTGRDMISIETQMQANNEFVLDPLLSRNFQGKMAARAGGIGADVLEAMPMQEFNKIANAARNFLIDSSED